jgi:hypothetical protein
MRVDGQKPAQDYNQSIKKFTEIFLGTENSTSNSNGMNKVLAALSHGVTSWPDSSFRNSAGVSLRNSPKLISGTLRLSRP